MQQNFIACDNYIKTGLGLGFNLKELQSYLNETTVKYQLIQCKGNQSEAARILGISRQTLRTYLNLPKSGNENEKILTTDECKPCNKTTP